MFWHGSRVYSEHNICLACATQNKTTKSLRSRSHCTLLCSGGGSFSLVEIVWIKKKQKTKTRHYPKTVELLEATRPLSAVTGSCWKSQVGAGSRHEGQETAGGTKQTRHVWTAKISNLTRQLGLRGGPTWHHDYELWGWTGAPFW